MVIDTVLSTVKKNLVELYDPVEIYIFGSYAWGEPTQESDIDILVVLKDYPKTRHEMLVDGHRALFELDVSKDLLVYSKEEFDRFSQDITRLCYKVKHEGLRIYAKA